MTSDSFPPTSPSNVPAPFTRTQWQRIIACVGFAGSMAADMSTEDDAHPGLAVALLARQDLSQAIGEDLLIELADDLTNGVEDLDEEAAEARFAKLTSTDEAPSDTAQ